MPTETETPVEQQIARLEERIAALEARLDNEAQIDYGAPGNTNEECRAHTCSYYRGYLAYGPPDLTHEGFHAAERNYESHCDSCKRGSMDNPCPVCLSLEKRIRA